MELACGRDEKFGPAHTDRLLIVTSVGKGASTTVRHVSPPSARCSVDQNCTLQPIIATSYDVRACIVADPRAQASPPSRTWRLTGSSENPVTSLSWGAVASLRCPTARI